ncbi:MAG: thiopurine S-methyltransferase [Pseudomonadota bacterium]
MKPKFWLERWQRNQIGFHQTQHNPMLLDYWPRLGLDPAESVFVPLCGKSLDMQWLAAQGHDVVGVELAQIAVENYFAQINEIPVNASVDRFTAYRGSSTTVYQGDFFDLTAPLLEGVRGVFDRGALVALPPDMRFRYVDHLLRIVPEECRILLLAVEYDQNLVAGPPHAVFDDEISEHYGLRCQVEQIDSIVTQNVPPHFEAQGVRQIVESVYLIDKNE